MPVMEHAPSGEVAIRLALIDDAPAIAGLHADCRERIGRDGLPSRIHQTGAEYEKMWRAALVQPSPPLLNLVIGRGTPLGFLSAGPPRDTCFEYEIEIYAIYIAFARQRNGLGSLLFAHGLARLRRWGRGSVYLWSRTDNEPARAFFSGIGGLYLGQGEGPDKTVEDAWGWKIPQLL